MKHISKKLHPVRAFLKNKLRDREFLIRCIPGFLLLFFTLYSYALLQHEDGVLLTALLLLAGGCAFFADCRIVSVCYLILLGFLTGMERHFIVHYGSFNEAGTQALITMHITDRDEILSYFRIIKPEEYVTLFLFLAGIVLFLIHFKPLMPPGRKKLLRVLSGMGAIFFPCLFLLIIGWRPVHDYFVDWGQQKEFFLKRKNFSFQAKDRDPGQPSVYFLVIGESHRKDEFDSIVLGGAAPLLTQAKKDGRLFEFDDMISYYQQTWFSVFTLLSRRGAEDQTIFFPEKGLFALFQEAGYKVYYITYQNRSLSATGYDCVVNEADVHINSREVTGKKQDDAMLPVIDDILAKNEPKVLIVLKMVGCHFNFMDRYPEDEKFRIYQPCYDEQNFHGYKPEERDILNNTYRNAMHFSASVLDGVAERCQSRKIPSAMLFLSDHGIINYEDGVNKFFGPAKSNFHIPCILYPNDAYLARMNPETQKLLRQRRNFPAGNDYIFDTLVSLADIDYPGKRTEKDLTSPSAKPALKRQVWVWKTKRDYDSLP